MSETVTEIGRRTVLAGSGGALALSAGSVLVGGALTDTASAAAGRRRPVVGVLTSSAPGRPGVARRADAFVAGLRIGLAGAQRRLLRAEVPGGHQGAVAQAESLIDRGAQVLVAAVSDARSSALEDLCARRKVALVLAPTGAQVRDQTPASGHPRSLHVSAQHWQASLSTGTWAASHLGRTLHHVVATPDAGFDTVFAVRRGFSAAGGTVLGTTVTHDGRPLADAVAEVRASGADVIAVSASGARASELARALRAAGVRGRFLLDPTITDHLSAFGGAADGAHLGATHRHEARHRTLARALRGRGAGPATTDSILGHDVGTLVVAGLARLGSRPWHRLPARLAGQHVPGVRGRQSIDATGQVSVRLAVHKVRKASGKRRSTPVTSRPRIAGTAPAMAVVQGRMASGYINEYTTT